MATITIRTNARDAIRRIARFRRVFDEKTLLRIVGQRHLNYIDENFRLQGAERAWRPLATSTRANPRRGAGARILRDTGRLAQSFTSRLRGRSVEVGTNVQYAEFHEEGTRPYVILPTRAKALRFFTADGVRFARSVQHPGLPARKMLPSKRLAENLAGDVIGATVQRAAGRV